MDIITHWKRPHLLIITMKTVSRYMTKLVTELPIVCAPGIRRNTLRAFLAFKKNTVMTKQLSIRSNLQKYQLGSQHLK